MAIRILKTLGLGVAISLMPILSNAQIKNLPSMVLIKGGTFKMGSTTGDADEMPVHSVTLSNYYISKYEVTVAQYKEFCIATNRKMPSEPPASWYDEHDHAVKWQWYYSYPIVNVTWYDANAYCKWLSDTTGEEYSLPTEAQWEYAARGGHQSKHYTYAGSNNINEVAWYDETTDEKGLKPVGRMRPNELGLYDMSGNAWEWCNDFYGKYSSSSQKDPKGPPSGNYKVIRGGSWYNIDDMCRSTLRDGPKPNFSDFYTGFRVVKKM